MSGAVRVFVCGLLLCIAGCDSGEQKVAIATSQKDTIEKTVLPHSTSPKLNSVPHELKSLPSNYVLQLGGVYNYKVDSGITVARPSGGYDSMNYVTLHHMVFGFCRDDRERIEYIECYDPKFSSAGIKVGDRYSAVKAQFPNLKIYKFAWGTFTAPGNGWFVVFDVPARKEGDTAISYNSKVIGFFKDKGIADRP